MADEQRTKRSAKKPAWMNDEMLIDPAEVEPEVKMPKPHVKKPHAGFEMAQRVPAHHEYIMPRQVRPSGRMCSNPQCKNPFDSPQWRRGPLGPGTLCNACGTRYARLQAKMNGDKKGKMRPQERAEWEAFEQQRLNPQVPQQTWRMHVQHFVQREQQQQQYYCQEDDYADYQESDYGYDERSYGSQGAYRQQQHYGADNDMHGPEGAEDGQLMCQEGLSDSPDMASRAAAAGAAAAAVGGARQGRPVWRGSRQHIPTAEAATDSQEDEAAAYSYSQEPTGLEAAGAAASSPGAPSSLLHLLAVGEAMIKTEGVALQERRAAYTEVVGKGVGPEQEKLPARTAGGDPSQGVKRSRFALEAEEQQGGRQASGPEPTALQRALERCGVQAAPQQRSKPAAGSEHMVTADRFERLLAEAEACVRARSVSPCMLKGVPGPGASPIRSNMPAPRPITPLQLGVNAVDAASGRAGLPRSFMGVDMGPQDGQHGIANFMLPAPAVPRRPGSATASGGHGRSRHASLAQAVAAAAAAEANSPGDEGEELQDSPHSQYGVSASNADSGANHGDAGRMLAAADFDAHLGAEGAAGSNLHQDVHGYAAGDMPSHMQVLLGQMPSTEPSPMSKMLLAEEVLSPSTMHMASHARPRKQARTHGPSAPGGRAGSGSTLSRSATPAERVPSDDAVAANMMQSGPMQQAQLSMQQHLMAQQGLSEPLLQQMMLQQGQQMQGMAATGTGSLPNAADLQQAGHRPVMLACQLVLQQQSNPVTLRPLFGAPATSTAPAPAGRAQNMPGLASSAELVTSALQLAQTGSGGNAQNHLDQLKAVTESAQAAAATASAVAAATALLWQQLQQQEQARARQREQELLQLEQDVQGQGQQEGGGVDADDAGIAAANEPAPPGSPDAAVVADPAAAQAASGSISRSSSSSTSAAGLSTAPGDSHGVEQPPAGAAAGQDQHQPAAQQAPACPDAAAPGAEAVLGGAAVGAEGHGVASMEVAGAAQALPDELLLVQYLDPMAVDPMAGGQAAVFDASQQGGML